MYHFLSGYTAKVAGTERGVTEPQATFSPCFGGPFLTLHPTVYARLLGQKMEQHQVKAYLINTGWTGGPYGVGHRMDLPSTRKIIDSVLDGSIEKANFSPHSIFRVLVPDTIGGIESSILDPKATWQDQEAYDQTALKLADDVDLEDMDYAPEQKADAGLALRWH